MMHLLLPSWSVVCDTANVRFFKQITTRKSFYSSSFGCLRYCKCTIFQANHNTIASNSINRRVVCDTANVRFFKQITTKSTIAVIRLSLFAILQMYDFSSKSQQIAKNGAKNKCCLRYCKCTIFQANHNGLTLIGPRTSVVCDTANVRFFKQITTIYSTLYTVNMLFAILQMYDFSSKSQQERKQTHWQSRCLRYCKCTIFQANHNTISNIMQNNVVVCDTANVRFFKQITTNAHVYIEGFRCLRYCKCTIFQANHNYVLCGANLPPVVCDTANVRFFKQITTYHEEGSHSIRCLRYCKCTIFQANHNATVACVLRDTVVCDTANVRFFKQITTLKSNSTCNNSCLRYCKCTIFQANHNRRRT